MIDDIEDGFSTGIFAYGQSGGGKSFSLLGKESDLAGPMRGLIPRVCEALFKTKEEKEAEARRCARESKRNTPQLLLVRGGAPLVFARVAAFRCVALRRPTDRLTPYPLRRC